MASSGPTKKQLQEAIKNYDIHAAIAILSKRSDWTNCDISEGDSELNEGYFPVHYACAYNTGVRILDWLLDHGADINAKTISANEETALHLATTQGNHRLISVLLDKNARLNEQDKQFGETALMRAAAFADVEIVELLLDRHPNIQLKNRHQRTASQLAGSKIIASSFKVDKIRQLIHDYDINEEANRLLTADSSEDGSLRQATERKRRVQDIHSPAPRSPLPSLDRFSARSPPVTPQKRPRIDQLPPSTSSTPPSWQSSYSRRFSSPGPSPLTSVSSWSPPPPLLSQLEQQVKVLTERLNQANEKNKNLFQQNNVHLDALTKAETLADSLQKQVAELQGKVISYEGDEGQLDQIESTSKCSELIALLDNTLRKLHQRKDALFSKELESSLNCLICREKRKTIAFLPCWHLCLCDDCFAAGKYATLLGTPSAASEELNSSAGAMDYLKKCPACRRDIRGHQTIFM